ncbi:MAG: head GIN domain-containing protein [Chloroflexota bacterium]
MKRTLTIVLLGTLILVLTACQGVRGNGNVTTESYNVSDFDSISLAGMGDLEITVGETESLTITTDENLLQYLEVAVEGSTLNIRTQNGVTIAQVTELTYAVTVTDLEAIDLSGAGTIILSDLTTESLVVDISGAGEATLSDLDVDNLSIEISGAGEATLSGEADDFLVDISGAGSINAYNLETVTADVEISGAGEANVQVSESLTGDLSGAASINYRGNATVDVDTSGVTSINRTDGE